MKTYKLFALCAAVLLPAWTVFAQEETLENTTSWKAEVFASAASGTNTPFWLASNRYGLVPLDAGNGYGLTGIAHHQRLNKDWSWQAGLSLAAVEPRYRNILIQEFFAGVSYKNLRLTIGSKENHTSLWNKALSSGDMVHSGNARPIPELNLSMPHFTLVP